MEPLVTAILVYLPAAALLTMTPGTDTLLVLRSATSAGSPAGVRVALGVGLGCLVWAAATAVGLAALIAASTVAYALLKWAGAGYLLWLGMRGLLRPRSALEQPREKRGQNGFAQGLLTNVMNPKVAVFYVSFLPQFVPAGAPVARVILLLGALHALLSLAWLSLLALGTRSLGPLLRRPSVVGLLDRLSGIALIGLGARLAMTSRP
jgi:threonine/homoserine/homoserine lactone efflux protein